MAGLMVITDMLFFIVMLLSVGYFFLFAFASLWGSKKRYPAALKKSRIVVFIPSYKGDRVIMDSVNSLLYQDYPDNLFDVVVISDRMEEETNLAISALPVILYEICPVNSSKAYALNYGIDKMDGEKYDIVVVIDADNVVDRTFLQSINDAYCSGSKAIQAHRTAKNTDTDIAILDALSEEINNSIFRLGHINCGLSSALIGSGMAFDYKWFKDNVNKLKTAGEDKELESLLLKDKIFIDYLNNVYVYDEKTKKADAFSRQRRRWLASQLGSLKMGLKDLPGAIWTLNIDYIDKIIQWMLLPRVLVLGVISVATILTTFFSFGLSIKWWLLMTVLLLTFVIASPDFITHKKNLKAVRKVPLIILLMFINLFRLRGVNKKFIHTDNS